MPKEYKPSFRKASSHIYDHIIVGGGIAGLFAAYKVLSAARQTGKSMSIAVLCDKVSYPCVAGNHFNHDIDALYETDFPEKPKLVSLLKSGLEDFRQMIRKENIRCQFQEGYEIKSETQEKNEQLRSLLLDGGLYAEKDISVKAAPVFNLNGFEHSFFIRNAGQVNLPELLKGLVRKIRSMGAMIIEDAHYTSHQKDQAITIIETSKGPYLSRRNPLFATGAEHMPGLPDFPYETQLYYTMALSLGPLTLNEAKKLSSRPVAFCVSQVEENDEFIWGSIDRKKMLTIGFGELPENIPEMREELYEELMSAMNFIAPGLTDRLTPQVSLGPVLNSSNGLPIVGRLDNYDVMGAWSGKGIIPSFTAAQAYAEWIVHGNDRSLEIFESLQDSFIKGKTEIRPRQVQAGPVM